MSDSEPQSVADTEALLSEIQPSMTFKQAFGPWLESRRGFISPRTYLDYGNSKKPLLKFFGNLPLNAITAGHVRQYQTLRLRSCGFASINHECSILQQMLKRVRVWAKIGDDYQPIPIPQVGPGKAITEVEEARWFAAAALKPGWRVAYLASMVSINTSAGPSEILGLKLENVRLNEVPPEIQIVAGTKNRYRIRHVPLNDKAEWAMEQLMARARELGATESAHYLFPFRVCKNNYDPHRHALAWKSAHIEICATAGIHMRIYDFRHTAITRMLEAGVPEETIRAVCGHVSGQMIRRYSHIRMQSKMLAVQAILGKAPQKAGTKPEKKTYLRIMVNCPTANKLVYTGMATDEASFRSDATSYGSSFICSECGQSHLWEKQDAFLLP
jgi:integrase